MDFPVVKVTQGKLQGFMSSDFKGGKFYRFQGIPYAEPPLGDLRFKAPDPKGPWTGIKDATKDGDACISKCDFTREKIGTENCLTLNVFTRNLPGNTESLKPVMVFIHGGGFTMGSSRTELYGPEFLMTEDIVLVTFNYRVGILGFLSLEDQSLDVPGNAGLKDQVLALKWVQENIRNFNGDPSNVTIFGNSAGSVSVNFHVLSPCSKGLFHKAILQSGSPLNPWAWGQSNGQQIMKQLGITANSDKEILEILKNIPVEKLFQTQEQIPDTLESSYHRIIGPVIEKPNKTAFLTKLPIELITSGDYNKVPMIFGYNNREGMLKEIFRHGEYDIKDSIPWQMGLKDDIEAVKHIVKLLEQQYFNNSENKTDAQFLLLGDSWFVATIIACVKLHLRTTDSPIYLYRGSIDLALNHLKNVGKFSHIPGASHADELGYMFKSRITPNFEKGSLEERSIERFVKLWTNFAKFGTPTPTEEFGVLWEPLKDEKHLKFLDIRNDELKIEENPEEGRLDVWEEIFKLSSLTEKYV